SPPPHARQSDVEDRRVRERHQLRCRQAPLRLARAGGCQYPRALASHRRGRTSPGDPGEAGDPGTGRGAGAACPDLRDARALPSRREARGVSAADETVDGALRSAASGPGVVIEGSRRRTWAELDHAAGEVATALTAAGAARG